MSNNKSNDKAGSKVEIVSFLQPNLFAEKGEIDKIRLLEHSVFSEDELFGKPDAYLEELEVLKGYAVDRTDCEKFYDHSRSLVILNAPKGMGKTTLCKLWEDKLSALEKHITIMPNYTEIRGFGGSIDYTTCNAIWKSNLLEMIVKRLVNISKVSLDHLHTLLDSNKPPKRKVTLSQYLLGVLDNDDSDLRKNLIPLTEKLKTSEDSVYWIFLDEFDADFTKEAMSVTRMAALLNAARELSSQFLNVNIRITIRPNVWATLRSNFALMANFKEFVAQIDWSTDEIRAILAKRIEKFLSRQSHLDLLNWQLVEFSKVEKENWLIAQVFDTEKFDLGKGNRPPERILSKLCADRPRWVIELCKAANRYKRRRPGVIHIGDVKGSFKDVGPSRLQDIAAEYNSSCPQISEVLMAFYNAKQSYILSDLLYYIEKEVTSKIDVEIMGVSKRCSPKQVASFLYELTFIEPMKKYSKGRYEFMHYKDFPEFLDIQAVNGAIERDLYWIIHPAFRDCLHIGVPANSEFDD